jgi:hypothetical protein
MALRDSTWRVHPFQTGSEYEPRETFRGRTGGEFIVGKRYTLRHVGHSHYDDSTMFRFQAQGDEPVDWWWHDDEPDNLCAERFRLVESAAGY